MHIQVLDEDLVKSDLVGKRVSNDELQVGEVTLKVSSMTANGGMDEWYQLQYKGKSSGQLHIKSVWHPTVSQATALAHATQMFGMAMSGQQVPMQQPMTYAQPPPPPAMGYAPQPLMKIES